jgi:hypothetical protein
VIFGGNVAHPSRELLLYVIDTGLPQPIGARPKDHREGTLYGRWATLGPWPSPGHVRRFAGSSRWHGDAVEECPIAISRLTLRCTGCSLTLREPNSANVAAEPAHFPACSAVCNRAISLRSRVMRKDGRRGARPKRAAFRWCPY